MFTFYGARLHPTTPCAPPTNRPPIFKHPRAHMKKSSCGSGPRRNRNEGPVADGWFRACTPCLGSRMEMRPGSGSTTDPYSIQSLLSERSFDSSLGYTRCTSKKRKACPIYICSQVPARRPGGGWSAPALDTIHAAIIAVSKHICAESMDPLDRYRPPRTGIEADAEAQPSFPVAAMASRENAAIAMGGHHLEMHQCLIGETSSQPRAWSCESAIQISR
ncbi:hypothetical protein B0H10DRAFT_2192830 [Mycena sp. CBHHK59/15]|nr:hypothetical protein B0H10DRAFT_2192830 [Mycena sp. CBHHK59/15]